MSKTELMDIEQECRYALMYVRAALDVGHFNTANSWIPELEERMGQHPVIDDFKKRIQELKEASSC